MVDADDPSDDGARSGEQADLTGTEAPGGDNGDQVAPRDEVERLRLEKAQADARLSELQLKEEEHARREQEEKRREQEEQRRKQEEKQRKHEARQADLAAAQIARQQAETDEKRIESEERVAEGKARRRFARLVEKRSYVLGGLALASLFAGLAAVTLALGKDMGLSNHSRLVVGVSFGIVAGLSLVCAAVLPGLMDARREQREVEKEARDAVAESADELDDAKDLVALIKANRKQMSAYDVLVQAQAKTAFRNAQFAMGAGLLVLLFGAIVALSTADVQAKIVTATLTAIGGTLAGFIAKTFLDTYRRSIQQLNFYFQQPLITSYLLAAQRLVNELSGTQRETSLTELIKRVAVTLIRPWVVPGSGLEEEREEPPTSGSNGLAAEKTSKAVGRKAGKTVPPKPRKGKTATGASA
jgi:TRADD-N domain-containing protein